MVQPLLSSLPTRPPPQMLASFCVVPLVPLGSMTGPALPKLRRGSGALMLWLYWALVWAPSGSVRRVIWPLPS